MLAALAVQEADFWRWVPHPEVWLLVASVAGLYAYAARVIGPKVVPAGTPTVTRSQRRWFVLGLLLLWASSDWPIHDIGEEYLYSVHMIQHTVLTLVMPPVMLLATPEWLARLVLGTGRIDRIVHRFARPIPAALIFNALALLVHAQFIVNNAPTNPFFHYSLHTVLVASSLLLWLPVCGPLPELRISVPAQMVYLFVTSLVPTVPGAWLVFAEGAVYSHYDIPQRMFGLSVTFDQQFAGAIMKLGAGTYLWLIITWLFFKWSAQNERDDKSAAVARRASPGTDPEVLTWSAVQQAFEEHPAPDVDQPLP